MRLGGLVYSANFDLQTPNPKFEVRSSNFEVFDCDLAGSSRINANFNISHLPIIVESIESCYSGLASLMALKKSHSTDSLDNCNKFNAFD